MCLSITHWNLHKMLIESLWGEDLNPLWHTCLTLFNLKLCIGWLYSARVKMSFKITKRSLERKIQNNCGLLIWSVSQNSMISSWRETTDRSNLWRGVWYIIAVRFCANLRCIDSHLYVKSAISSKIQGIKCKLPSSEMGFFFLNQISSEVFKLC